MSPVAQRYNSFLVIFFFLYFFCEGKKAIKRLWDKSSNQVLLHIEFFFVVLLDEVSLINNVLDAKKSLDNRGGLYDQNLISRYDTLYHGIMILFL